MTTRNDHAIALLGAACALLAALPFTTTAQGLLDDHEISESFIFRAGRHVIAPNMDIQPGAGLGTAPNRLPGDLPGPNPPAHDLNPPHHLAEPSRAPMIFDRQHPEAW